MRLTKEPLAGAQNIGLNREDHFLEKHVMLIPYTSVSCFSLYIHNKNIYKLYKNIQDHNMGILFNVKLLKQTQKNRLWQASTGAFAARLAEDLRMARLSTKSLNRVQKESSTSLNHGGMFHGLHLFGSQKDEDPAVRCTNSTQKSKANKCVETAVKECNMQQKTNKCKFVFNCCNGRVQCQHCKSPAIVFSVKPASALC